MKTALTTEERSKIIDLIKGRIIDDISQCIQFGDFEMLDQVLDSVANFNDKPDDELLSHVNDDDAEELGL